MDETARALIVLAVALFLIAAFWLGYNTANTFERRAHSATKKALRKEQAQKQEISRWVRANWPDEYNAYKRGHRDGYQQGILQAPELEARAEDAT